MACQCESAAAASCLCTFTAGLNVSISGGGTPSDPVRIDVVPLTLIAAPSTGMTVKITGTGDVPDPYIIRMELDPALYETKAGRWVGSEERLAVDPPGPGVIAAVTESPTKHLVNLVSLYGGTDRFVRVYVGDVMVADESGGTLGPGI